MGYDLNESNITLGSYTRVPNVHAPRWLVVANNPIANQAAGPSLTITLTPTTGPPLLVDYGKVGHFPIEACIAFTIVGAGANISVILADKDVPLEVSVVTTSVAATVTGNVNAAVSGNVNATIVNPITGAGSVKVHDVGA